MLHYMIKSETIECYFGETRSTNLYKIQISITLTNINLHYSIDGNIFSMYVFKKVKIHCEYHGPLSLPASGT